MSRVDEPFYCCNKRYLLIFYCQSFQSIRLILISYLQKLFAYYHTGPKGNRSYMCMVNNAITYNDAQKGAETYNNLIFEIYSST